MTQYHILYPDGGTASGEWTGRLEHGWPSFKDIRSRLMFEPNALLEHVSVLWKGRPAHMFVDEMGLITQPPRQVNPRASRIYWNATLNRFKYTALLYNDLTLDYKVPRSYSLLLNELELADSPIVGPAFLWEGVLNDD